MNIKVLLLLYYPLLAISTAVTIADSTVFRSQRPCAKDCFGFTLEDADRMANNIGCDTTNECICRPDLQEGADAWISQCVDSSCDSNTLDTNSAVSIYDQYCTANNFLRTAAATTTEDSASRTSSSILPSETTPTLSSPSQSVSVSTPLIPSSQSSASALFSSTNTNSPTSTSTSQNPTETLKLSLGGDSLGVGEIIGIVVGVLGFFATAAGSYYAYKATKKRHGQSSLESRNSSLVGNMELASNATTDWAGYGQWGPYSNSGGRHFGDT